MESKFEQFDNGAIIQQVMVYKPTGEVGAVERVESLNSGLAKEIVLRLKDDSGRRGPVSDFEDATGEQRSSYLG
jgi:hypothetical protein